ncbi:hypothetical protein SteCoe_37552 [Stentor coeruleus]|uniref:Uncharacterized protein n=1 Tax=Stentor coeruleus TaxID=5963 RepID=A0A1R2AMT1_9CILI|nr:hypothetical protein SteCoe_37552 [Stentor coeruleus]
MNPLTGGAHYLELSQSPVRPSLPRSPQKEGVASIVFSERQYNYNSKFIEEEHQRRLSEFQKKQESFMKRRNQNILKEADRWQAVEDDHFKSIDKLEYMKDKLKVGLRNKAGEAFNLITLDYDSTEKGKQLQMQDDRKRFRLGLRMNNLDSKMNSGFNVITGEIREPPMTHRYLS